MLFPLFSFKKILSFFFTDEYDKHPNEVVKNEELTYNNNGGISLMGNHRQTINRSKIFLFNLMPEQLSFIALTLAIVFILNYLLIVQSKFIAPCISLKQQSHTESSQRSRSKSDEYDDGSVDLMECDRNNKKLASIAHRGTLQQYQRHQTVNYVNKTLPKVTLSKLNIKQCSIGHTTIINNTKMFKISTKTTTNTTATIAATIKYKNNANFNINSMCGPFTSLQHRFNKKNVTITTPTDTKTDIITINNTADTKYKIQQKYDIITLRKVFNSFYEKKMKSTEHSISKTKLMMTQITMLIEPTTMNYSKTWIFVHNLNTIKNRILERYDDDYTIHELIAIYANYGIHTVAINEQQLQLQKQQLQQRQKHLLHCITNYSNAFAVVNNNTTNSDKIITNNNKNEKNIFKINHNIHSCNNVNTIDKCNCKFSLEHHTDCIRYSNNNDKLQLNSIINIKQTDHDDNVDQLATKQLICTYTKCATIVNRFCHR